MWSNVAGKWPGSLGLFGLLQIHDRFEHSKLRSRSRDGDEFFGDANFINLTRVSWKTHRETCNSLGILEP